MLHLRRVSMKKSLVVLAVLVFSIAVTAVAFADDGVTYKPSKKIFPPKCYSIPYKTYTSEPGSPFAVVKKPRGTSQVFTAPVYRPVCMGGKKGGTAACFGPKVTWSVKWMTMEECGTYKYRVKIPFGKETWTEGKQPLEAVGGKTAAAVGCK
jgi:hypothetical protein